jgi:hypothetical protein
MTDAARPLSGPLRDADAILDAMMARKEARGLSNELVDELAGVAEGGWSKRFGPSREKAPGLPVLMMFADVLGVSFVMVEDEAKMARMESRWTRRSERNVQDTGRLARIAIKRALPAAVHKLASSGGKARWSGVDADERRRLMRKLARKRWSA